ncbi:MAG: phosphate/phosphite/phosphonate ABC transporter substrate-binding protein [gamma proteobacterium endosymbiont of Lamellibrachia anaximandri]|nr:phosphate/phosphite/phosphonate ABC transporter substrate-binding protein [gamma proteobacterium endosymbiont of Lamellibrachia anaximandri]MBL3618793.1 phosphate/phosphite/phosphonate ABC transporter substrate-binding protein [gamma proteobacterium endosymbiont of Lamellibrachia anaximandri]
MKYLIQAIAALFILSTIQPAAMAQEPPTLTFGLVPQQSATKLARLWGPIMQYIGKKSGTRLVFKTAPNIPEFERRCAKGEYDIAYMNPYHYTVFHDSPGYEVFARQKNKRIRGIVVVRKENAIHSLHDLAGKTLAFPAPAAFAASVLPRANIANNDIPFSAKYVSSHDSVYRSIAKGLYIAGGGIQRTFNNVDPTVREQLRILWTSGSFTPHAFAAHPRVDPAAITRIKEVMINMENDPEGKRLLASINFKGIEVGKNKDWDDVRALGIDLLKKLTEG